jgi:electron transfer flavoprotein beta subunit
VQIYLNSIKDWRRKNMNILVCIKQVPDTTEVKLDPKTGTLIRDGVPSIINPDDKAGLEEALNLKDKFNANVTVLTMGPPQAKNALKEALAMGADKGILLTDRAFAGADTLATSSTLAGAIKKIDYDLIIAGRQAIDGDTAQVGPQIAQHLDIPSITYVEKLEIEGDSLIVNRAFEDGYAVLKSKMPLLITTLKEMNTPRYMRVSGIYDSFNEENIQTWNLNDIEVCLDDIGLKGSPTKVKKSFTKGAKSAGKIHDVDEKQGASIILNALEEKFIITK